MDVVSIRRCGSFPGTDKWGPPIALPDERVLFPPFNATSILIFDSLTETYEEVGNFEGECKWAGACRLPSDGRVVFTPFCAPSILIFNPCDKTWETVGHFEGECKWKGCVLAPDGRVIFAPCCASALLTFDPVSQKCETFGHFEGEGKWKGCILAADGRVVCAPYCSQSILTFSTADNSFETFGNFQGNCKWSGCAFSPSGQVIFTPHCAESILIFNCSDNSTELVGGFEGVDKWKDCSVLPDGQVVFVPYCSSTSIIFDVVKKSWTAVGQFTGRYKWNGCAVVPSGKVIFSPEDANFILVMEHTLWYSPAAALAAVKSALPATALLWGDGAVADGMVDAGVGAKQKAIPVHRSVLASSCSVLAKMFEEAAEPRIALPDDPEVVEAVLEYIYTGNLPFKSPLGVVLLAHRLELVDCMSVSAARLDECTNIAAIIRALVPLLEVQPIKAAWLRIYRKILANPMIFDSVLRELALDIPARAA